MPRRVSSLLIAACGVLAAPAVARADAVGAYYERTAMTEADRRCGLFAPPVALALTAARAQARGAALRGGASPDQLAQVSARATAKIAAADCASTDIRTAADRVRAAFAAYGRMPRLDLPGASRGWTAVRPAPDGPVAWRLRQSAAFGADAMTFGLAGRGRRDALMAVAVFADGARPYAARLVARDPRRTSEPYLPQGGSGPLSARLPPPSATQTFTAEARSVAGTDLRPAGARAADAFRFPAQGAAALATLDPREAVAVEFLFEGDRTRTAFVEVGDFAAGTAFLAAGDGAGQR